MQRFFLHSGILVALVLGLVAFAARFGAAYARDAQKSIPVRHEISGAHFAYQVTEKDSSDSIAARFGEPELTLFPDGSEQMRVARSRSIIATWRRRQSIRAS